MIPKGGETIWGELDWSPEGGSFSYNAKKLKKNGTHNTGQNTNSNVCDMKGVNYGRIISFGKDVAEAPSSKIERVDFRVMSKL